MTPLLPITFSAIIGLLVFIDLRLVTRNPRVVSPLDGFTSFVLWVLAAVAFGQLIGHVYQTNWLNLEAELSEPISETPLNLDGHSAWLQFLTAYVIELALSLDNIALMAMIIASFDVPKPMVARALLWHVLLSLIVRLGMIMSAAWLLRTFGWMYWVFGVVLAAAMVRTLLLPEGASDLRDRWPTRYLLRPLTPRRWTPQDYAHATVILNNGGPDALIYTDPFGSTVRYAGEGGAVSFNVVPAPAGAAVGLAILALVPRRRSWAACGR